ncbi:MAG TPA: hypothetical protein VGD89_05225 [Flavipsychrobacter sp.]
MAKIIAIAFILFSAYVVKHQNTAAVAAAGMQDMSYTIAHK